MTLRTSLFNRGIYKSVLKRFWWVSVVYFVLLFMLTVIVTLTDKNIDMYTRLDAKYLFSNLGCIFVMFLGVIMASLMALFVYSFAHSKKQSLFIYALPVTRVENFVSSALAGFTLLILPILLNGTILAILSLTGYREYFGVYECVEWVLMNLMCIFIIFAYSGFSSMLTGNVAAAVMLNVVIYAVMMYSGNIINNLGEEFLFGYMASEAGSEYELMKWSPIGWFADLMLDNIFMGTVNPVANIESKYLIFHIGIAMVMYVASFILCIKRKMESVGEVGGFKILNPIFKYGMTFLVSIYVLTVYADEVNGKIPALILALVVVSAVTYFVLTAMIEKKLNVWKSYKGYVVFLAVFALFVISLTCTSFFGYETRVPDVNDIESVAIQKVTYGDYDEPFVDDEEIKEYVTKLHKKIVKEKEEYPVRHLTIKYKLKNGRTINRKYMMRDNYMRDVNTELYKYDSYRQSRYARILNGFENVEKIVIGAQVWLYGDNCYEFLECVKKDLIECDAESLCKEEYYATVYCGEEKISFYISDGFDATVKWLKEKGEWQYMQKTMLR